MPPRLFARSALAMQHSAAPSNSARTQSSRRWEQEKAFGNGVKTTQPRPQSKSWTVGRARSRWVSHESQVYQEPSPNFVQLAALGRRSSPSSCGECHSTSCTNNFHHHIGSVAPFTPPSSEGSASPPLSATKSSPLESTPDVPRHRVLTLLQYLGTPIGCFSIQHVSELESIPGLDLETGMSQVAFMPVWVDVPDDRVWTAVDACKAGLRLPKGGVGNKAWLLKGHLEKVGRADIAVEHWYELLDWLCPECQFMNWACNSSCRECKNRLSSPPSSSSEQQPKLQPIRLNARTALCADLLEARAHAQPVLVLSGSDKQAPRGAASRRSAEADKTRLPVFPVGMPQAPTPSTILPLPSTLPLTPPATPPAPSLQLRSSFSSCASHTFLGDSSDDEVVIAPRRRREHLPPPIAPPSHPESAADHAAAPFMAPSPSGPQGLSRLFSPPQAEARFDAMLYNAIHTPPTLPPSCF